MLIYDIGKGREKGGEREREREGGETEVDRQTKRR